MSFFKRAARRLLRRPVRLLLRAVHRRIDEVNDRVDEVNDLAEQVHRHLPIVETVIESQNAELRSRVRAEAAMRAELERLKSDLSRTQRQLEELRREVGGRSTGEGPVELPNGLSLAQRLGSNGSELRLEFVCGQRSASDRVGIDLRDWRDADLAAALRDLPLVEHSAVEVRGSRVLECFSIAELRDVVLRLWYSLLRADGELVVVSIDADANLADYHAGRLTMEQLTASSFGAGDERPPRRGMLGEDLLATLLRDAGFESIETVSRWRESDGTNLIEIRARRGGAATLPKDVASGTNVGR